MYTPFGYKSLTKELDIHIYYLYSKHHRCVERELELFKVSPLGFSPVSISRTGEKRKTSLLYHIDLILLYY